MTEPFKAEAEQLVRGKVDHIFTAVALPLVGEPFGLDVTSASIGFDESWVPHIQANLTCALPSSDNLEMLDARKGCRVRISTGYRYGFEDEEIHLLADLHLRERTINHESNDMTLELMSDEELLRDHIMFGNETVRRSGINEFVYDVLKMTGPQYVAFIRSDFDDGTFETELKGDPATITSASTELTPAFGKTAWTLIDELQRRTGAWVYTRNGLDWNIAERAEVSGTPVHSLSIGENGTVLAGRSTLSRDSFYNEVLLKYEWKDEGFLPPEMHQIGQARITGGPLSIYEIGRQTYVEIIDRRANKAQADRAALDKLSRVLTKGYEFTVRAVAAYWVRAGDTVALTLDDKTENLLVKSVNFDLAEGTMALVLRKPEHATLTNEAS
jgi:hypothetical protein